jgi:flagellar basal-body rod protein FlgF
VALRGGGYFVLDTAAGRRYTRNGRFTIGRDGYLSSPEGYHVLGTRGPIALTGSQATFDEQGTVSCDGKVVDRLLVVDFAARGQLSHVAGTGITGATPTQVASVSLATESVEDSNVIPSMELAAMTAGYRVYEANARAVTQLDQSLGQLIQAATA